VEIIHRHPCLSAAVLACGPWWHFGTGECGCPMELELGVGATVSGSDAPFFLLHRAEIRSAPRRELFF
jgi:hypothetical protein